MIQLQNPRKLIIDSRSIISRDISVGLVFLYNLVLKFIKLNKPLEGIILIPMAP